MIQRHVGLYVIRKPFFIIGFEVGEAASHVVVRLVTEPVITSDVRLIMFCQCCGDGERRGNDDRKTGVSSDGSVGGTIQLDGWLKFFRVEFDCCFCCCNSV